MTTEPHASAYYRACYEIPPAGARLETAGPVRVLMADGRWLVPPPERPTVREEGEIREARPALSYDVFGTRQKVCRCGAKYTGPPNKRACDDCRGN